MGKTDRESPHTGNVDRLGSWMKTSNGQADACLAHNVRFGPTDRSNVSTSAETITMGRKDGTSTYLGAGDAKRGIYETDSIKSRADVLSTRTDMRNIETNVKIPKSITEKIKTLRTKPESLSSPASVKRWCSGMANGSENLTDPLTLSTDVHSVENKSKMPMENVRTTQKEPQAQNSPASTEKWRTGVGDGHIDHLHRRREGKEPSLRERVATMQMWPVGQSDALKGQADVPSVLNDAEMTLIETDMRETLNLNHTLVACTINQIPNLLRPAAYMGT